MTTKAEALEALDQLFDRRKNSSSSAFEEYCTELRDTIRAALTGGGEPVVKSSAYYGRYSVTVNGVDVCSLYDGRPAQPVTFTFRADADKAAFIAEQAFKIAKTATPPLQSGDA